MGGLRSGRPLCSQFSFCHLYRSGPRQQSCSPPQVRIITHSHTRSKKVFTELLHTWEQILVLIEENSLFFLSTDGTSLSLKTTLKVGRP